MYAKSTYGERDGDEKEGVDGFEGSCDAASMNS